MRNPASWLHELVYVESRQGQLHERLKKKHGKGKALSVLAAKLARAAYFMLKRGQVFDNAKFFQD